MAKRPSPGSSENLKPIRSTSVEMKSNGCKAIDSKNTCMKYMEMKSNGCKAIDLKNDGCQSIETKSDRAGTPLLTPPQGGSGG